MTENSTIRPSELRVSKGRQSLTVVFENGETFNLPAEALRVMSPSAEVQGHSADQRVTVPGKRQVCISGVEPVGNYAVKIAFDDGHDTGIFTWKYLHELGSELDSRWSDYLAELEDKGMSRDRAEVPR
ncbi:gamma-butyrobetaine hydroxylase-like domain-containing protein [Hoeflea sp. TYP-13]|uniref:gamma-butyrobetaine hydroxylase-like domain-containing protein n=1 Tax=Hoeflea sp. TYP-13 TaxID=3230023 RepID=UPI0034C63862